MSSANTAFVAGLVLSAPAVAAYLTGNIDLTDAVVRVGVAHALSWGAARSVTMLVNAYRSEDDAESVPRRRHDDMALDGSDA